MSGHRSGPARRAVLRWAWRLFRRDWRQQVLVLALLVVAVAAATTVATVATNAAAKSNPKFGTASGLAVLDATNPRTANAQVANARRRFGSVDVITHRSVDVPGSADSLDVRAQDPNGEFSRSLVALRDGRYPKTANEVALTDDVASLLGVDVGARVELGGVERTVVGRVENPSDLSDTFALIAPGARSPAQTMTLLFDFQHEGRGGASAAGSSSIPVEGRTQTNQVAALVLVATTLVLGLVGLIAAAGFVVVAQRRQRQLGMLAAIGATERHLRLVMVANGAFVGGVAAVVGVVLGVLGWIAAAPAVEVAVNYRIDRFHLPWALIAECAGLAVVMATAAAWWPARNLGRTSVMGAVSGRPPRPRPVHRSLALALALVALGLGGVVLSHPTGAGYQPLLLLAGLVAVMLGVVLAAPAAIRAAAAPAARLPFATRLALRDLARYQARAAAALAAITLAISISVAIVGIAGANVRSADEGNMSSHQLVIRRSGEGTPVDPRIGAADRSALDVGAARVARALGDPTRVPLDIAIGANISDDPQTWDPVSVGRPMSASSTRMVAVAFVATPALLRHYGIDPSTIGDRTDLLTARKGNLSLVDVTTRGGAHPTTERVDLPSYTSAPSALLTEGALRRHGWHEARTGWLIESKRPLTSTQIAAARSAAAVAGLTIETRSGQAGLATLRTIATVSGGLLALAVIAMTIGLIRGESAGDLRTLTATGAGGRTRRTLTASTAGALALLGVVLGAAGAYAALVAGYHSELGRLLPLPLRDLALLAVGLPAIATVAGWLLAGREPRTFSRQALE